MPIKKRKLPNRYKAKPEKFLKSPARRKHERECAALLTMVNSDVDDKMRQAMRTIIGFDRSAYLFVEELMSRVSCEVVTLQMNGTYARGATYRCCMSYQDRKKPLVNGRYPTLYCVKTSTRLIHSVILCYIELCKHIGRFV